MFNRKRDDETPTDTLPPAADEQPEPEAIPMATKRNDRCLQNAKPDEPIFVLRAQDTFAPIAVQYWIDMAKSAGGTPVDKINEAKQLVQRMYEWQAKHGSKVPD